MADYSLYAEIVPQLAPDFTSVAKKALTGSLTPLKATMAAEGAKLETATAQAFGKGLGADIAAEGRKALSGSLKGAQSVASSEGAKLGNTAAAGFNKEFAQSTQNQSDKVGKSGGSGFGMAFVGAAALAVTAGAALIFKGLISPAAALSAAQSTAGTVFKDAGKEVIAFSETTAKALGISSKDALTSANRFGNLFTSLGKSGGEAAGLSKGLITASANMAAFADTDPSQVLDAISAAMIGEYDSLQRLVPTISAASIEQRALADSGKKSVDQLTAQDKAMATNSIILESNANKTGAAELAQNGLAVQTNKTIATFEDWGAAIGQKLLPLVNSLVTWVADKLIPAVQEFWQTHGPGIISVFKDIGSAISNTVDWVKSNSDWLLPIAAGIAAAAAAWGLWTAAVSIWQGVVKAAIAIQAAWNFILSANPIGIIILALIALGTALYVAYQKSETFRNIVDSVFRVIGEVASWVWNTILKPVFTAIGEIVTWLWNNIFSPYFTLIGNIISVIFTVAGWAWNNILKPVFETIGVVVVWLWNNVFSPYFTFIGDIISNTFKAIKWVWDNVLKPVFDGIGNAVTWVKDMFQRGVDGIRTIWNKLEDIAKVPVRFVVNTVFNEGIRPMWNWIADKVGLGPIDPIRLPFAAGGIAPGTGNRDTVPAMLTPGEGVLTTKEIAKLGGPAGFNAFRAQLQHFAGGGIVGNVIGGLGNLISSGAGKVRGFLADTVESMLQPIRSVIGQIPGQGSFADAVRRIPTSLIDKILDWVRGDDKTNRPAITVGGELGAWIAAGIARTGVPSSWAGPLSTLIMRESGGNPNAINLTDINAQQGHPSQGLMQTIPGTFASYRDPGLVNSITDPIANIVAGIRYILARYGDISNVQQANPNAAPLGYARGGYVLDSGGTLQPGWNLAYNGLGRPEPLVPADRGNKAIRLDDYTIDRLAQKLATRPAVLTVDKKVLGEAVGDELLKGYRP